MFLIFIHSRYTVYYSILLFLLFITNQLVNLLFTIFVFIYSLVMNVLCYTPSHHIIHILPFIFHRITYADVAVINSPDGTDVSGSAGGESRV